MTDAAALAAALLDAQVEFVVAELSGSALIAAIGRDVDEVLDFAATVSLASVVDVGAVQAAARRFTDAIGGSSMLVDLRPELADAIYASTAGDDRLLGDVVGREHVDALLAKLLSMHQLHERAIARMSQSPAVASIASTYVAKILGDFVQQNRERAEKLPGVSSLFSIGLGAAGRVRGAADGLLGDAQLRSTQFAMRQSGSALRDVLREAPVHEAAMEIWDLHAAEPISELRHYLTAADLRELSAIVGDIVTTVRNQDAVGQLIDESVQVFFDRYGNIDLAGLLRELGLSRDVLVEQIARFAPPVIEAARADGSLQAFVRSRLEPFFTDPSTLALLAGAGNATPQRPRPRPAQD